MFSFALRLFFLTYGGQFYLFYVKCTYKENSPGNKTDINIFHIQFEMFRYLYLK